ncbi:MAG: hypothetical protein Q7U34_13035 [Anaerolineales bacterium]|nr:hypothetical protein [Anaerolineales bacterium]
MALYSDIERGKKVADILYRCFATTGIHGQTEMPEDIAPKGVIQGSLEHILFIALSVSIDYQRNADVLWASSRQTYGDPETRYLFNPQLLHEKPFSMIVRDMQKYKLSKKPQQDPNTWHMVGVSFHKKWQGDPRNFLASCNWDAPLILARLKVDSHLRNGKRAPDFPFLRGDKIGPLWLRMLRDNAGLIQIRNLNKVPIPVDIHVARATLASGVVRGQYKGRLDSLFEIIRQAWFESVEGLTVDDQQMIALDVDEPLWHLSRYGCTHRDKLTGNCPVYDHCEVKEFCIKGKVAIQNTLVELGT